MANDGIAIIVQLVADLGSEITNTIGDPDGRVGLLARAGVAFPVGSPPGPSGQSVADALSALKAQASGQPATSGGPGGTNPDVLGLLEQLSVAMIDLVAFIQQALSLNNLDDAWNLLADLLDIVALDRLRLHNPEWVAILQALHLVSNDRLLLADLVRSGHEWGTFLLGDPVDDDAQADNWSLIIGAAIAVLSKYIPAEDSLQKTWRTDMLFGWDPDPDVDPTTGSALAPHAQSVLQRMVTLRLTHRDRIGDNLPADQQDVVEEFADVSAVVVAPGDGGWGLFLGLGMGGTITFPIGQHLELRLGLDSGSALNVFLGDPPFISGDVSGITGFIELRRKQELADHWTIGGDDDLHLEIGTFSAKFTLADPATFKLSIGDGAVAIPAKDFLFLSSVAPSEGTKLNFDLDVEVDSHGKWSIAGGAGLTVTLPVNTSVSVFKVRSITVALVSDDSVTAPASANVTAGIGPSLAVTVAFSVDFGPAFRVTVDNLGLKLLLALPSSPTPIGGAAPPTATHGNLATWGDLDLDFVPPRGIGITLDIGPIKGGGFLLFDSPHRTYAGMFEATLSLCGKGLSIKAAGLLRETADGWDLVVILSAQFNPAIEMFLGMSLSGVGGMLGINVAVDVAKLQSSLHDGSVGRLLFPTDPVANAPAIVATMANVFPHHEGGFVAGPMLQISWGHPDSFVTLSVAVVISLQSPALLLILGRLQVGVSKPGSPIVDIKVDFLGTINFDQPSFSFDASIVDSRVAAFPLTGDMAMRAGQPGFMLAFGGFNPQFTPPANMPTLRRLAIDISANPATKIRAEAYLAVTSNTFQIGLHASLDISAGPASIHGWVDFDALIQWEPTFRFSIHMDIGLELKVGGHSIAGVSVDLLLEGPGPWHAKGRASLHILFFTVHAGFECTWGEIESTIVEPVLDASAQVAAALGEDGAWSAVAPDGDAWITFREITRDDVGVHPYGQITAKQQALPLAIPITRIGLATVVGGTATVTLAPIAGAPAASPTTGQFAASQFMELTDDQKLSRPSFEAYQDGVAFGANQTVHSSEQLTTATYETVFIPEPPPASPATAPPPATVDVALMVHALDFGAIVRSGLYFATLNDGPSQPVTVSDPQYRVVSADTLVPAAAAAAPFGSSAAAFAAADAIGGRLLVVGAHEAVA
jgi:hypothetical protein